MSEDKPLNPEAERAIAKVRRLMMIASVTTFLAVAAVLVVIGYRVFRMGESAPPPATEISAALPAGAKILSSAVGEGRIAALEVLLHSYGVAHMIRENKTHQIGAYLQSAPVDSGMQNLDGCLLRYVQEGLVDTDEALRVANFPETLRKMIAALPEER